MLLVNTMSSVLIAQSARGNRAVALCLASPTLLAALFCRDDGVIRATAPGCRGRRHVVALYVSSRLEYLVHGGNGPARHSVSCSSFSRIARWNDCVRMVTLGRGGDGGSTPLHDRDSEPLSYIYGHRVPSCEGGAGLCPWLNAVDIF